MTSGGSNRKPDAIRTRALQMVKDGYTAAQTARELGVSKGAVAEWLHGRVRPGRPAPPEPELSEGIRLLHRWPNLTEG